MSGPAPTAWRGYALVLAAATLFGVNAGVSRIALRSGMETSTFTSVRIVGAFVVFVALAAAIDRSALRLPVWRSVPVIIGLGLLGVVGVQWTYNIAIDRLPLGIALLLEYLGPALVVLWVRFVRRGPVSPRVWPALALTLVGLAAVGQVWDGLSLDAFGVAMALSAAVCFAAYFLLGEHRSVVDASPVHAIVWAFAAGAVIMTVISPAWRADELGDDVSALGRFAEFQVPAWTAMVWVVVLGTVAPFFLLLLALRMLPSTVVSVTAMVEPVVASALGWYWFGETLSVVQMAGVALVLLGIVGAQTARLREPERAVPPV